MKFPVYFCFTLEFLLPTNYPHESATSLCSPHLPTWVGSTHGLWVCGFKKDTSNVKRWSKSCKPTSPPFFRTRKSPRICIDLTGCPIGGLGGGAKLPRLHSPPPWWRHCARIMARNLCRPGVWQHVIASGLGMLIFYSSNFTHKSCGIFVASWGVAHCIGTRLIFHDFVLFLGT